MGFWFFVCFLNNDICGAGHNSTGKGGEISVGNYNHPIATCFLPWLFLSSAHVNMKVSSKKKKSVLLQTCILALGPLQEKRGLKV